MTQSTQRKVPNAGKRHNSVHGRLIPSIIHLKWLNFCKSFYISYLGFSLENRPGYWWTVVGIACGMGAVLVAFFLLRAMEELMAWVERLRRSCKDFVVRIGWLSPVSHGTRLAIQSRGIHTPCEEGVKTSLCCCKDTQSPVKDFFERLPLVRFT